MIDAAKSKGETGNKEEQEEVVLEDLVLAEGEEEEADDDLANDPEVGLMSGRSWMSADLNYHFNLNWPA